MLDGSSVELPSVLLVAVVMIGNKGKVKFVRVGLRLLPIMTTVTRNTDGSTTLEPSSIQSWKRQPSPFASAPNSAPIGRGRGAMPSITTLTGTSF
jgi:hypothetical protein